MMLALLRSNFPLKLRSCRVILHSRHALKATCILHEHRAYKHTVKGVVFDMGGVILPSPLPAIHKAEKELGLPSGIIGEMVIKKYSDDDGG